MGGELVGASVLIELDGLQGRVRWPAGPLLHTLLHY
jgi:adenine phosphoribosyltransferase